MPRIRSGLVAMFVFFVGCAVGGGASRFVVPPAHAKDVQRWDYFCFSGETVPEMFVEKAKTAGAEGWELVAPVITAGRTSFCFKRPL
jgi:hypothetical protein